MVALGGNALARRGEPISAERMLENIRSTVGELAELAREHQVVLTHGNGPQVGLLDLQNLAYPEVPPYPLDILGAQSQGMIGYPLQRELRNALGPGHQVATVLTTTLVSSSDPDFGDPSKFIGPLYSQEEAQAHSEHFGWDIKADGVGYRRVVPSPQPAQILESAAIATLVEQGFLVICVGGGGAPVVLDDGLELGVEAVVDKDLASAVLAEELGADVLLILTDADYVVEGYGEDQPRNIAAARPSVLAKMNFAAGSMGPKVEAACAMAESGGTAFIGPLGRVDDILQGKVGTRVSNDVAEALIYT